MTGFVDPYACCIRVGLLVGMMVAVTGCSRTTPVSTQTEAIGQIRIDLVPAHPHSLDHVTFVARPQDAHHVHVSEVSGSLSMPSMDMGNVKITFTPGGDGQFRGFGQFTMAGQWSIHVAAKTDKGPIVEDVPVTVQ